jgi:hypothetical protein
MRFIKLGGLVVFAGGIVTGSIPVSLVGQPTAECKKFEEERRQSWEKKGKTSKSAQQSDLISLLGYYLPRTSFLGRYFPGYYERTVICIYNLLRHSEGLKPADSVREIDKDWVTQLDYNLWKERKRASWQREGVTALDAQVSKLIEGVNRDLNQLAHNPQDEYYKKETLYGYNFLRELLHESPALSLAEIDKRWLTELDYNLWKESKRAQLQKSFKTTLVQQVGILTEDIEYDLNRLAQNPSELYKREALYDYNFLRELLHLSPASSVDEIDKTWASEVAEEVNPYGTMDLHGYGVPLSGQKELIDQARKLLDIQEEIAVFSFPSMIGGASGTIKGKPYIALCRTPDLDGHLYTIYHELGHIVHHDSQNTGLMLAGSKSPQEFLDDPEFKADIDRITRYLELGKKALDTSTDVGKRIHAILAQHATLWNPPADPQKYKEMLVERGQEERADLFALDKLFEQKNIGPLLTTIDEWSSSNYIVAEGAQDPHPSSIERALYIAGFLVDKGIDVNAALREWEHEGMCIPSGEFEFITDTSLEGKSQGAQDFLKVYKAWLDKQQAQDYEQFKREREQAWDRQGLAATQRILELVWLVEKNLKALKADPFSKHNNREALFSYNFARELYKLPRAASIKDIDRKWLERIARDGESDKEKLVAAQQELF